MYVHARVVKMPVPSKASPDETYALDMGVDTCNNRNNIKSGAKNRKGCANASRRRYPKKKKTIYYSKNILGHDKTIP